MNYNSYNSIGNYTGISKEKVVPYEAIGEIRFVIYGAYNAYGAIAPENNGIVILSDKYARVVCDRIAIADTGYFGPSDEQLEEFERLTSLNEDQLIQFINIHPQSRFRIKKSAEAKGAIELIERQQR